ncbi:MAG: MerR family transcriptional regulator [Smithellaceae bacterium]
MKTQTISQMAAAFGLSRSALLYYDKIGLLSPAGRSRSGYRLYSAADALRMKDISKLRNAGVALRDIRALLAGGASKRGDILRERLCAINDEISSLRRQQHLIIRLVGDTSLVNSTRVMTREQWVQCLQSAGLNEAGRDRWHLEFEASSPEAHQDFLESLGLSEDEITHIRGAYKKMLKRKR